MTATQCLQTLETYFPNQPRLPGEGLAHGCSVIIHDY